jgi:hypothetical protein
MKKVRHCIIHCHNLYEHLSKRSEISSDDPTEAVVSFKADRGTSYDIYLEILDELQGAYYEIYGQRVGLTADEFRASRQEKSCWNMRSIRRARDGFPMNISIAEPTKIGGN